MSAAKGKLRITLVRSLIGTPKPQRDVARGLGLRKPNDSVVRPDHPAIRGMVEKIPHLVHVEIAP
ncbi:MAG: 50S ribosomal protein L30 [Candidatus Aminicenantes bacterium]|nr:50S ribosomal protein L30 [Candidatus Aminicenantes bacterium]